MALGVGLMFGVHPLQVESVAWLAERKNLLCGLFGLGALAAYLRAVSGEWRRWWWAVTALFVGGAVEQADGGVAAGGNAGAGLLSTAAARDGGWWRLLREKTLLFILTAIVAVITIAAQHHWGAMAEMAQLSLLGRALVAARATIFYLWKLIWPDWLSPYYPLFGSITLRQMEFLVPTLACVIITAVCVWQWRRGIVLAAWVAYLALILPVSGVMQAGAQAVADRFMYLAMLPPLFLVAAGAVGSGAGWKNRAAAAGRGGGRSLDRERPADAGADSGVAR